VSSRSSPPLHVAIVLGINRRAHAAIRQRYVDVPIEPQRIVIAHFRRDAARDRSNPPHVMTLIVARRIASIESLDDLDALEVRRSPRWRRGARGRPSMIERDGGVGQRIAIEAFQTPRR
jgi:hypothetical protein